VPLRGSSAVEDGVVQDYEVGLFHRCSFCLRGFSFGSDEVDGPPSMKLLSCDYDIGIIMDSLVVIS
jgi:hypothetical protein